MKIDVAIVERDDDAPWRKGSGVEPLHGFAERQHRAARGAENLEPLREIRRRHIERGIPFVLVGQRHAVVAENQQPPAPPRAVEQQLKSADRLDGLQRDALQTAPASTSHVVPPARRTWKKGTCPSS